MLKGGIHQYSFNLIAGAPGTGKTTLALGCGAGAHHDRSGGA
ncbi:MAG: hypothetical protein ABIT38_01075 [Gemmatimonadaceae bacterium]